MIVPDSLYGAFMLSTIDFILSVVMISGVGIILALFPLLNRIGKRNLHFPSPCFLN